MTLWNKLKERLASLRGRPALDALLAHANPNHPLAVRLEWAEDLFAWVRRDVPTTRLKLLLQLMERQPEARERVAGTLRSVLRETHALDLLADTGLPKGAAFSHEFMARLFEQVLPERPDSRNLDDVFDRLFPNDEDADWLEKLDPQLAASMMAWFEDRTAVGDWSGLQTDFEDALMLLADRIGVIGSQREMRERLEIIAFRELPFQKLPGAVAALLAKYQDGTPRTELVPELNHVRALMDGCDKAMSQVVSRLEQTGVSMALVYDLARLRAQLRRLEMLLEVWAAPDRSALRLLNLVADLARQNHERKSVVALCRQNLQLLTRRIVDRNAETGEHYVARNRSEYFSMLLSAAGGGALTGLTTLLKLLLAKVALAEFFKGAVAGLNYAGSFVLIQLCGFTLATKQPATTAPALARRMEDLRSPTQLEAFVDEVVFLIRSQNAAVLGNLALVIPAVFLLDFGQKLLTGQHVVDEHKATVILQSISPLSMAWPFAIFTGVLLWASSVVAAWADNWFVLHQLGPTLAQHRRWKQVLGPTRARRWAGWLEHNVAGLAGNISLGFMLGLAPVVAVFFGLPLDVRHVTLSTGQVTAAFATLGWEQLLRWTTFGTIVGIVGIGVLNLAVSFGLALLVAIRARNVRGLERSHLYRALWHRIFHAPLSFVLPIKTVTPTPPPPAAH
jgi:site-specific recombinase